MIENKYLKLKHLFSCYFHQDMYLEYKDAENALKAYVMETSNDNIKLALNGIDELQKEGYNEKSLSDFISRKLGSSYYYEDDNITGEAWLEYVSTTIKKYLAEKQKLEQIKSQEEKNQRL